MPTERYKTHARFTADPVTAHLGSGWHLLMQDLGFCIGDDVLLTAPRFMISDGPSIPLLAEWIVPRKEVMPMGFLHDALRLQLCTSNFATDGLMVDAALACGLPYWRALAAFLGVRIGTAVGFESKPPEHIVRRAMKQVGNALECPLEQLRYNENRSRILPAQMPKL